MSVKTPRPASPRLWTNAALMGAATGLAVSAPLAAMAHVNTIPLAPVERLWLAQADGGEAGEAGAVEGVAPDVAYLVRLRIVEGHLVAAAHLYRDGLTIEGVALSGHPEAEMMDDVRESLEQYGAADFTDAMDAFTMVMADGASQADVDAALANAVAGIDAAAAKAGHGPRVEFDALIALTRAAANEYAGALENGQIAEIMGFFEANGFLAVAKRQAEALAASDDPVVAAAGAKAVAALADTETAFPMIDSGTPQPSDPAILVAAASAIEFASYPVK